MKVSLHSNDLSTRSFAHTRRHFFLKLREQNIEHDDPDNFAKTLTEFGAKLDVRLIEQFVEEFSSDVTIDNKKLKMIPLQAVSDYYLSRHPTEPPPVKKANKKKKKKKKGDKDKKERTVKKK